MVVIYGIATTLAVIVLAFAARLLARRVHAQHEAHVAADDAAVADTLANAKTWIDRADIEDQDPDVLFHHDDATPQHW